MPFFEILHVNLTYQNRNHVIVKYPTANTMIKLHFYLVSFSTFFQGYVCIFVFAFHIIGKQTETDFNSITENITYFKAFQV